MPINYSKWDKLELSDDEDNFHPNIDNNLMIRLQREKRAQREKEEEERKAALRKVKKRGGGRGGGRGGWGVGWGARKGASSEARRQTYAPVPRVSPQGEGA